MADVPESFWDNLLDYIQEGTVVPVIGSELVTVREGEQDVPLDYWLARRLAEDLALPTAGLPKGFALNEVVSLYQRERGDRVDLYPRINRILRNAPLTPPEPLLALASIPSFNLFVSLTFDSLLAEALGAARGGLNTNAIAHSPKNRGDLVCRKAELQKPVVFHLLGKASTSQNYAICDEDLLEFLYGLQDKHRYPKKLFDELRGNHLLILGCNFGDWLARFFLRAVRNLELSQKRQYLDMLVGYHIAQDTGLVLFLESFSSETRVIPLTAAELVTQLAQRWHAAHPPAEPGEESDEEPDVATDIPEGAIFVSYAHEDLEAASRLANGLRMADLQVWFDKNALEAGDKWAPRIYRGIRKCSLFLPVISRQSLSENNRRDRFFWEEWNYAASFIHRMAQDEVFIVPVVIDDSSQEHDALPDAFKHAQGRSLPGGIVEPDFIERLKALVREFRRRKSSGMT